MVGLTVIGVEERVHQFALGRRDVGRRQGSEFEVGEIAVLRHHVGGQYHAHMTSCTTSCLGAYASLPGGRWPFLGRRLAHPSGWQLDGRFSLLP